MSRQQSVSKLLVEQKKIEARGVLASRAAALRIRREVLADYRARRKIGFRHLLAPLTEQLRDAMLLAFLTGVQRSKRDMRFALFDDAIEQLERITGMTTDDLRSQFGDDAAKVYEKMGLNAESKLNDAVAELIREGVHVKEGAARLGQAFADLGMSPGKAWQIEGLFRTQVAVAYEAGRWQGDQDPAIQEILWGYEYVTVGDDRVRPTHEALDGTKLPKEDPFWRTFWPPNGWNCRCVALPIYHGEEEATPKFPPSETEEGIPVVPDKGFAFNSGSIISV